MRYFPHVDTAAGLPFVCVSGRSDTRQATRIADVTVSVILMVAGFLGFAVLAFMSLFLVMMSDGCFGDRCNTGLMSVGWLIALGVPPVVFLAAAVWTIIRLVRRKFSWWVAAVGAASGVAIWFVGVGIMNASLGR